MFKEILARLRQGYRTISYPKGTAPTLSERFRGRPVINKSKCVEGCALCKQACPVQAIKQTDHSIDLGRCLFCTDCSDACPHHALSYSKEWKLSARTREELIVDSFEDQPVLARELEQKIKRIFGRSLRLRQVSAGGCGACEADTNVLGTIGWDLGRFGIQFVASPRHADGILITGPVTKNMELALTKTWNAIPEPKIAIAVGACAISGGPYTDFTETLGGAHTVIPVDLFIPGCPPHPLTILDGLLRLLGRIEDEKRKR